MSLSLKSQILNLLNEQIDQIKSKKSLKLNNFIYQYNISLFDLVETINEFLNSSQPPLELERLSLQNNQINELSPNFKVLSKKLRYLDLHNNNLSNFPEAISNFYNLEILDLSSNRLYNISPSILNLKHLRVISLKENRFKYLSPILGELQTLNLIEVADNPLILPPFDLIKNFQKQNPDLDWVSELKNYLINNKTLLEFRLNEQYEQKLQQKTSSQPLLIRSKSVSETKSKASKAARRMGLIIKKTEDVSNNDDSNVMETSDSNNNSSIFGTSEVLSISPEYQLPNLPHSASAVETSFNIITPPPFNSSITTSTVSNSSNNSPSSTPAPITSSNSSSNLSTLSRTSSRNRSRSNTLKEIDKILEKNDNVDAEHKSGAYFRRLSTLKENPIDETLPVNNHSISNVLPVASGTNPSSSNSSRQGSLSQQVKNFKEQQHDDEPITSVKSPNTATNTRSNNYSATEISPSKTNLLNKKANRDPTTIIKISRKVLFSFSELHSSIRRFTGFCVDKKITIKMVSYIYTTKSNIDSLVENLEIMEESGNNLDQILSSLHTCISSFRTIMDFLSENLSSFVVKIDICFIRMLYLTLFGSLNELLNSYRILTPNSKPAMFNISSINQSTSISTINTLESKQKLSINTHMSNDFEDVDEKLYKSIEIATSNAQVVFSELTNAIGKSAIASATTSSNPSINHNLANKIKELTNVCMSSMDITKRLQTKLITIRNNPSQTTKKLFWDDINIFLKAVIQTFSSVKAIMKDLPILNEVRASMANLTKTTKDVTIMLEVSSYKSMSSDSNNSQNSASTHPSQIASLPSTSNVFTLPSAHPSLQSHSLSSVNLSQLNNNSLLANQTNGPPPVRTPLVATLGPAAQAIMPVMSSESSNTGFSSPIVSPNTSNNNITNIAPVTAPAQSSGQYFAKNGVNPFDGLIMANRDKEKEQNVNDHESK